MSTVVDLSTRNCTTPGCDGQAARNVAGLPFCQDCIDAEPHRVLKACAQRAEIRRQAQLEDEREARRRTDEVGRRRRRNTASKERLLDGRSRTLITLKRLHDQALKRKDDNLAAALRVATQQITEHLDVRKIA